MTARYKVYRWMLTLETFTAGELSEFSEINLKTVHTVLARLPDDVLVEVAAAHDTVRARGGQVKRYRLSDSGREYLLGRVRELEEAVAPPGLDTDATRGTRWAPPDASGESDDRPSEGNEEEPSSVPVSLALALDVAREALDYRFPAADTAAARASALDTARTSLRDVRAVLHSIEQHAGPGWARADAARVAFVAAVHGAETQLQTAAEAAQALEQLAKPLRRRADEGAISLREILGTIGIAVESEVVTPTASDLETSAEEMHSVRASAGSAARGPLTEEAVGEVALPRHLFGMTVADFIRGRAFQKAARRLKMQVFTRPDEPIKVALAKMVQHDIESLPVLTDEHAVGTLTFQASVAAASRAASTAGARGGGAVVSEVASREPWEVVDAEMPMPQLAARLFHDLDRVVVRGVDGRLGRHKPQWLGVVRADDVWRALAHGLDVRGASSREARPRKQKQTFHPRGRK